MMSTDISSSVDTVDSGYDMSSSDVSDVSSDPIDTNTSSSSSEVATVMEKNISLMMQAKMQAMKVMDASGLQEYDPTD